MPPRGGTFLAQGDLKVPCELNNTAGFSALTIRSSRARFAASALAGYDLTIANAAQRPGLAQALDCPARLSKSEGKHEQAPSSYCGSTS